MFFLKRKERFRRQYIGFFAGSVKRPLRGSIPSRAAEQGIDEIFF